MLFSNNLFENALCKFSSGSVCKVKIISGYATSAMAKRHLSAFPNLCISLLVGMTPLDGISLVNHNGFCTLASNNNFSCFYSVSTPVHSKVYIWYDASGKPLYACTGSANYTQQALILEHQQEILLECSPELMHNYALSLEAKIPAIICSDPKVNSQIKFYQGSFRRSVTTSTSSNISTPINLDTIELPLVDRDGNVPLRSGLNWGQRDARDKNQAYLKIPATIAKSGFFPPRTVRFNVLASDGQLLTMVVAQDGDKALHTPDNNAIIGEYFRRRLGVPSGALVTLADLKRYGKLSVRFIRDDSENYYMEF